MCGFPCWGLRPWRQQVLPNICKFLPHYPVSSSWQFRTRVGPSSVFCSQALYFLSPSFVSPPHILVIPGSKFSVDLKRVRENDKHSKAPSTWRFVCRSGDSMAYTQIPRVFVFCLLRLNLNHFQLLGVCGVNYFPLPKGMLLGQNLPIPMTIFAV
jgi:hypothetical protein